MDVFYRFDYIFHNGCFDCAISVATSKCHLLNLQKILFLMFAKQVINMVNLGFPVLKTQIFEAVKLYLYKSNMKIGVFTGFDQEYLCFMDFFVDT